MFVLHSSQFSGFSGNLGALDALGAAAGLPFLPLPQFLGTLRDWGDVGGYSEIRGTRRKTGIKESTVCQKEKKNAGGGIWERIQGDFLPLNLPEVSGYSFSTFVPS